MRRLATALAVAAVTLPSALAVTGCGSDDGVAFDAAKAAKATKAKGTATIAMTIRATGLGLPQPVTLEADGVTDLQKPRGTLAMDFGPLLGQFGQSGDGKVAVRFDGSQVHVQVPDREELRLPGGKRWVAVDLKAVAEAAGLPTEGLAGLFALDPATQLEVIRASADLKEVGTETIAGAKTTHYKGSYTLGDFIDALPDAERAATREALKKLDALTKSGTSTADQKTPSEIWIDGDGVVRRMSAVSESPAQPGVPKGRFAITYELTEFGADLDVSPPPAADTFDATTAVSQALGSQLNP